MNRPNRWVPAWLLVLFLAVSASAAVAQEPATPAEEDDSDSAMEADTPKKIPLGLYVSVAAGGGDVDDLNTSNSTDENHRVESRLTLDDQTYARAAVGWRLPKGKGDFRLVFNGYKEDSYDFQSVGLKRLVLSSGNPSSGDALDLFAWWNLSIKDGDLTAIKSAPTWLPGAPGCVPSTGGDDANCNGKADAGEVRYPTVNTVFRQVVPDSLENQAQTVDFLYGREFGGRRFSSRWWCGARYFKYEGNVPAAAWLTVNEGTGEGFTNGALLGPLIFSQETTGWGPTGSWEVDFNFFNKGLVLFVRGQSALTFNQNKVDTGEFFTLVSDAATNGFISARARLRESREKSGWQNTAEAGARLMFKNGLEVEVGYSRTGLLDAVLMPTSIQIPTAPAQRFQGTSALYLTQDYVIDTWHAGVGYQF